MLLTGHVQQGDEGPLDVASLRMVLELLGQDLQGAAGAIGAMGGNGGQRYLAIVPERVVLGTAPTTVSTF